MPNKTRENYECCLFLNVAINHAIPNIAICPGRRAVLLSDVVSPGATHSRTRASVGGKFVSCYTLSVGTNVVFRLEVQDIGTANCPLPLKFNQLMSNFGQRDHVGRERLSWRFFSVAKSSKRAFGSPVFFSVQWSINFLLRVCVRVCVCVCVCRDCLSFCLALSHTHTHRRVKTHVLTRQVQARNLFLRRWYSVLGSGIFPVST